MQMQSTCWPLASFTASHGKSRQVTICLKLRAFHCAEERACRKTPPQVRFEFPTYLCLYMFVFLPMCVLFCPQTGCQGTSGLALCHSLCSLTGSSSRFCHKQLCQGGFRLRSGFGLWWQCTVGLQHRTGALVGFRLGSVFVCSSFSYVSFGSV